MREKGPIAAYKNQFLHQGLGDISTNKDFYVNFP